VRVGGARIALMALLCGAIRSMLRHPTVAESPEIPPMHTTASLDDDNSTDDCDRCKESKGSSQSHSGTA
jgi:hypothetical protein